MSYSQFKEEIKKGSFDLVSISPDSVRAKKVQGTKFKELIALRVEDPSLVPLLEEKNIKFEGVAGGDWLGEFLVTWVLPMVFVFFYLAILFGPRFKGPTRLCCFLEKAKQNFLIKEKKR